jgi:LysR family glycine cleavage system transcriptional activator
MASLPPLNALRAFEAAARTGGFARAAAELHVTPAAISQQVRQLERYLGVVLFEREGRGLALTDAGRAGLERLSRAFDLIGEAAAAWRAGEAERDLIIAADAGLAGGWLAPRLFALPEEALAGVRLTWLDGSAQDRLRRGEAELALTYAQDPPSGAEVLVESAETVTPAAAPGLAAQVRTKEALDACRLLHDLGPLAAADGLDWRSWLAGEGLYGLDLESGDRMGDPAALLSAAAAGRGLALVRRRLAAPLIASGALVPLFADGDRPSPARYRLSAMRGSGLSLSARRLAEALSTQLADEEIAADEL